MPINTDVRLIDEHNWGYGIKHIDNKPRVSSMPYLYDIAEGNVPGHSGWSKMGFNSDIQTAEEIVSPQGGTYAFPTAAMQMQAVSSSVEDDPDKGGSVAGTGVFTLTIYYLDASWVEKSETVTLNGQTAVDTAATDIYRIQNVRVATTGTGLKAAGNISIKGKADGLTYGYIAIGNTRQRQFAWTVPANRNLYMTQANVYCKLSKRLTNGIFMPYAEAVLADTPIAVTYTIPKVFHEKVDIIVVGKSTGTATVAIAMGGWLETT